jgi:uncharacterized protein YaeQ
LGNLDIKMDASTKFEYGWLAFQNCKMNMFGFTKKTPKIANFAKISIQKIDTKKLTKIIEYCRKTLKNNRFLQNYNQ